MEAFGALMAAMTPGAVLNQVHSSVQDFILGKRKSWGEKLSLTFGHGVSLK